jgi:hypothetical protein
MWNKVYSAKPFLILRLRTLLWELTLLKNISSLPASRSTISVLLFTLETHNHSVEPVAYDTVVSGLVLNFVPQPSLALSAMIRAVRLGGTVAAYVWDYTGHMQLIRYFWDAAVALDRTITVLDEGRRFPLCHQEPLSQMFRNAQLEKVKVWPIDVDTTFSDFDDYWSPFLGGQGPAPAYTMSLSEEKRVTLREYVRKKLPIAPDGSIHLIARAWAVLGARKK